MKKGFSKKQTTIIAIFLVFIFSVVVMAMILTNNRAEKTAEPSIKTDVKKPEVRENTSEDISIMPDPGMPAEMLKDAIKIEDMPKLGEAAYAAEIDMPNPKN